MQILMYVASFGSVFALFASVIGGLLWVLASFIQAWGQFFRALLDPPDTLKRHRDAPVGLHPHHLKRAGQ